MVDESKKIWSLGSDIDLVDKYISWKPNEVPSFAECDILIVDESSLNEKLLESMDNETMDTLFQEIQKRFNAGNFLIVCIISKTFEISCSYDDDEGTYDVDNYFWSPVSCSVEKIGKGSGALKDFTEDSFPFQEYVPKIKKWDIAIQEGLYLKSDYYEIMYSQRAKSYNLITTKSNDVLGGQYYQNSLNESIIFLHPLATYEKSIQQILKILGGNKSTFVPPWVDSIIIPSTEKTTKQIQTLKKDISKKQMEVQSLQQTLFEKNKIKKLIYETDDELEDIVKYALELLNLNKVKKGEPGKDDLILNHYSLLIILYVLLK